MTRVLLVGLMATGKSTVGRALAARLGCAYLDNDDVLLEQTGVTARALAARDGEEALRTAEADALRAILRTPGPWVAGAAAGAVLDAALRDSVRDSGAFVVWLAAPPEVLAERVGGHPGHRPWLDGDPLAALEAMAAERGPLYAEIAPQVLDVSTGTPDLLAQRIEARLAD